MKSTLALIAAAGLGLFATGCSTVAINTTQYVGVPKFAPTDPMSVQVLRVSPVTPNIRLGEVIAQPQGSPSATEIEQKLKNAAAKLGANAVVIVEDRTMVTGAVVTGPWWGRSASPTLGQVVVGVAIRYQ
jgi:hypothetical protein